MPCKEEEDKVNREQNRRSQWLMVNGRRYLLQVTRLLVYYTNIHVTNNSSTRLLTIFCLPLHKNPCQSALSVFVINKTPKTLKTKKKVLSVLHVLFIKEQNTQNIQNKSLSTIVQVVFNKKIRVNPLYPWSL